MVAELSPPAPRRQLEPVDPRLRATLHVAGHELTTEADWPEEMRIDVDPPRAGSGT